LENFFVYIIATSANKKIISYVGWTSNLKKRLELHNSGKGAKFTRGRKWFLIFKRKSSEIIFKIWNVDWRSSFRKK
jgi:putative endonuclease